MIALIKMKYMVQLRYSEMQRLKSSRIVDYFCSCLLMGKQKNVYSSQVATQTHPLLQKSYSPHLN